jgi:hypothetical protein
VIRDFLPNNRCCLAKCHVLTTSNPTRHSISRLTSQSTLKHTIQPSTSCSTSLFSHFVSSIMLLGPLLVLAVAAPRPQGTSTCAESSESSSSTSTVTIDATLTWTRTYTHTVTTEASSECASSTSSAKMAVPTKPYNVISAQTGSLINAAGLSFHLGGDTASYCPDTVTENGGKCPPGDITALIGTCSMVGFP